MGIDIGCERGGSTCCEHEVEDMALFRCAVGAPSGVPSWPLALPESWPTP